MAQSDTYFQLFDEMLPYVTAYEKFDIEAVALNLKLVSHQILITKPGFIEFMVNDANYLTQVDIGGRWFKLTPLGKDIKAAGGHYLFYKNAEQEKIGTAWRKKTDDELKSLQIKLLKFENNSGKSIKVGSLLAVVASIIVSASVSLYTRKGIDKETLTDTATFNKSIRNIEQQLKTLQQPTEHKLQTTVKDTL
jgi:hypothetical protein